MRRVAELVWPFAVLCVLFLGVTGTMWWATNYVVEHAMARPADCEQYIAKAKEMLSWFDRDKWGDQAQRDAVASFAASNIAIAEGCGR